VRRLQTVGLRSLQTSLWWEEEISSLFAQIQTHRAWLHVGNPEKRQQIDGVSESFL